MKDFNRKWFLDRLKALDRSQADFGRHMEAATGDNYDRSTVHHIFHGNRALRLNEIEAAARFFRATNFDVLAASGVEFTEADVPTFTDSSMQHAMQFLEVPEIDVRAGAGGGGVALLERDGDIDRDAVRATWGLPPDYLRRDIGVTPERARIVSVRGDSMEPTLRHGDHVMIDVGHNQPSPPGIYCLWDGMGVIIKRLELVLNSKPKKIRVISDNTSHGETTMLLSDVAVIGRAAWIARAI